MHHNLTFVTGNPNKVIWFKRFAGFTVNHQKLDLPEIQSLDIRQVVEHKAKEAYRQLQTPVLIEDTSLTFKALGKLPGPFIKWFLEELGNEGMCHLLDGYNDRSAVAEVAFAYYDGTTCSIFRGQAEGTITPAPHGDNGYGWDPIFIPAGYTQTWGEMNAEDQRATSIRQKVLIQIGTFLEAQTS